VNIMGSSKNVLIDVLSYLLCGVFHPAELLKAYS
jgi:hypothetical protein